MADVSKIFKPRRGKKSTMAGTKKTTVLSNGEMFIEVPDTGSGTGHCRMKIGDGSTQYSSLPYAMGDTENDTIAFSSNTSTTVATALNSVTSGGKLKNLIAGLKQAVSLCSSSITKLNNDLSNKASTTTVNSIKNTLEYLGIKNNAYGLQISNIKTMRTLDSEEHYGGMKIYYPTKKEGVNCPTIVFDGNEFKVPSNMGGKYIVTRIGLGSKNGKMYIYLYFNADGVMYEGYTPLENYTSIK